MVADSIAIQLNGTYYDVHNDYNFIGLMKNDTTKTAVLFFEKKMASWVNSEAPKYLLLFFYGLNFFELSIIDVVLPAKLEEIGFKDPTDFDIDWLISNQNEQDNLHIIFRLEGDGFIRIGGEKSECVIAATL